MKTSILKKVIITFFAIGFALISCDNGNNGNNDNDQNKIIIQNIPANVYNTYVPNEGFIFIFPAGASVIQNNMVAAADLENEDIVFEGTDTLTVTIPLYIVNTSIPWTENGNFDVYLKLNETGPLNIYKSNSPVNFTAIIVAISFNDMAAFNDMTGSSIIDGCSYSQKKTAGTGTHYLLSMPYEDALSILNNRYGTNETTKSMMVYQGSSLSSGSDWVIFEDRENEVRLVQSVSGTQSGVWWSKNNT
jgi:uncharacterized lipoprotein NlpE involved in copper resistance